MITLPIHKEADRILYTKGTPQQDSVHSPESELEQANRLEATFHGMTLPDEEDVVVGSPGCQHCEVTPKPIKGPGTLSLRFPHTHSLGKILSFLADSSWQHTLHDGTLSVHIPPGSLAPLLAPITERLSPVEQRDTRATFQPDGQVVKADDLFKIDSLPDFVAKARSEWLLCILRAKLLYSVFQPIVRCNSTRSDGGYEVHGYECLMRAEVDGAAASPGAMLDMARASGLLFQLDLAARRAAITGAAAHNIQHKVFINFTPNSIYNPYSCLDSTVRMIDEVGLGREQVVFEIIESERLPDIKHLQRIVGFYRDNGFGVALDDVGAGFSSLSLLIALQPDYVKLDMSLTRDVHKDKARALMTRKLLETMRELELKTVAEGIEMEAELEWVHEHGADFVQGYLFARPGSSPPLR